MDKTDAFMLALVACLAALIVGCLVFLFNILDDDMWSKGVNGCYIHEVHKNHFGSDTTTITELCPVRKN